MWATEPPFHLVIVTVSIGSHSFVRFEADNCNNTQFWSLGKARSQHHFLLRSIFLPGFYLQEDVESMCVACRCANLGTHMLLKRCSLREPKLSSGWRGADGFAVFLLGLLPSTLVAGGAVQGGSHDP